MKNKLISFLAAGVLMAIPMLMAMPLAARAEVLDTVAKQAILVDADSGTVLLAKNENEKMPTSSMSKVMTIYMVFDALKAGRLHLEDKFTVSENAWKFGKGGSSMFLPVHSEVSVEDLIRGVIIQSGNDATIVLAEGMNGSEEVFVDAMNKRAQELGLKDSHFMNASGWPVDNHYSTARDLSLLAYRTMTDFPEYFHYFSEKEFTFNNIRQQNRDPLLGRLPGADGMKTGHTEIAGYGLMGTAQRNGHRLILILNGLESTQARIDEGARVMEWGFHNFDWLTIVKKGQQVETAPVWLGVEPEVQLVAEKDVNLVVPQSQRNQIVMQMSYTAPIRAPLKQGDAIAKLKISVPDQTPVEINLVAGKDVPQMGFFARAKARLAYLITRHT